ncbi:MAG: hypothetical protein C0508_26575, partial [Cyanobacteria bacterium PR.023]|nr:hypothetical protein [Cyanobacteria bacterium PR.023]
MKPVLFNNFALSRLLLLSAFTASSFMLTAPVLALETSPAITLGSQDFTLDSDNKEHEKEKK